MPGYRFIDNLTSDVMFESCGNSPRELFENSALALSEVICKTKKVRHEKKLEVEVKAENLKELLFHWLQEIIAQTDIENMFFSKFTIKKITSTYLKAELHGSEIKPELGETVVKAVTRHEFSLKTPEQTKDGYRAVVVLDI